MKNDIRARRGVQHSTPSASTSTPTGQIHRLPATTQPDEFLRRALLADVKPAAPEGQIPGEVTEAFIRLITLLDARTDGGPALDLVVRDRASGETAGVVPLSEDTAIAILSAFTASAANVGELAPQHDRSADTAPARVLHLIAGGAR